MTQAEYDQFLLEQKWLARRHLRSLILSWRVQLWPRTADDPIEREDRMRVERATIYAAQRHGLNIQPASVASLVGSVL